jgi:hypothetical protein
MTSFFMTGTGLLTGCADRVSPPPTPAYYAYYPGACPTFGPALPSKGQEIAWRTDSSAPLTVPGGANADCILPDSLFGQPPIYGPPYRTYGAHLYGPIVYRP